MLLPSGFQLERARTLLEDPGDLSISDIEEFIARSSARESAERKRMRRIMALPWMTGIAAVTVGAIVWVWVANGQQAAFRFYMTLLAVGIFVSLRDGEFDA